MRLGRLLPNDRKLGGVVADRRGIMPSVVLDRAVHLRQTSQDPILDYAFENGKRDRPGSKRRVMETLDVEPLAKTFARLVA